MVCIPSEINYWVQRGIFWVVQLNFPVESGVAFQWGITKNVSGGEIG